MFYIFVAAVAVVVELACALGYAYMIHHYPNELGSSPGRYRHLRW